MALATAHWLQGEALLRLNRVEAAPIDPRGARERARAAPDTKLHGDLVMAEAGVLATQGQVQPALQDYQAAYRIFGKAGEARSQAMALYNIGSIYQDAARLREGAAVPRPGRRGLPGDPVLVVTAHNNIGRAYRPGQLAEAVAEFERAGRAQQMKSPLLETHILTNLASAEIDLNRLVSAQRHPIEAEAHRARRLGARLAAVVWGVQAQIELKRGDRRRRRACWRRPSRAST